MTSNTHSGDGPLERAMHIDVNGDLIYVKLLLHRSPETREHYPTLVFLHEALGSVGQWKSFPRELCMATGCDGVVYDRLGHGQSSPMQKIRDLHFYREEAEVALPALLSALNIHQPLLVGHSDGATIALKYASSFPSSPVGVVSMAAHVIIEDVTIAGIRDAQRLYTETDLRAKLTRYHGDKTDAVFSAWADTWLRPGMKKWNMLDDLRLITCPVLIIQGERDVYGSRAQVDAIAEHVHGQHEILWLKDCGHVPHLEARQTVNAAVCRFIGEARLRE